MLKEKDPREIYEISQMKAGYKKGDTVKILRKAEGNTQGWENNWVLQMDNFVGKTGVIIKDPSKYGVTISVIFSGEDKTFTFPYFVLEKVR